jgi:hypothetical protein
VQQKQIEQQTIGIAANDVLHWGAILDKITG